MDFEIFLISWKKIRNPILIGLNVKSYDISILVNQLTKYGLLEQFRNSINIMLKFDKNILKKGNGVENSKQETLIRSILETD